VGVVPAGGAGRSGEAAGWGPTSVWGPAGAGGHSVRGHDRLYVAAAAAGLTAHRRFTEWSRARVWGKLHRLVLDELGARGELDWSRCAIDSVNMRATKGGT
jgi:hypothetical protein